MRVVVAKGRSPVGLVVKADEVPANLVAVAMERRVAEGATRTMPRKPPKASASLPPSPLSAAMPLLLSPEPGGFSMAFMTATCFSVDSEAKEVAPGCVFSVAACSAANAPRKSFCCSGVMEVRT
jgi:hypothetical protein